MRMILHTAAFIILCCLFSPPDGNGQVVDSTKSSSGQTAAKALFENDKVLEITMTCNVRDLLFDRSEKSSYHRAVVSYRNEDSTEIVVPARVKTRGHFRKQKMNCVYPPLLVNFTKGDSLKSSIFKGQDKLKLVMPCVGDEYVIREWMVYKIYNLLTPKSLRAKLVRVKLVNSKSKKTTGPFYGILLEDEKQMAKRNGEIIVNKSIHPARANRNDFITTAVFEYLAGNTDWSVQFRHNTILMAADSNAICTVIPYDFDHSGLVSAPYAEPPEKLNLSSVRERRYRGYCITDLKAYDDAIALFNRVKDDIYSLYKECPYLDDRYKKTALKYLDEFYATINNPRAVKDEFGYPCNEAGTGNVVIKGLKED